MGFAFPSQQIVQKLSLPLIPSENIALFLVTMSFTSCALFHALAYPVWPLHSSTVLVYSS